MVYKYLMDSKITKHEGCASPSWSSVVSRFGTTTISIIASVTISIIASVTTKLYISV